MKSWLIRNYIQLSILSPMIVLAAPALGSCGGEPGTVVVLEQTGGGAPSEVQTLGQVAEVAGAILAPRAPAKP